ncbi:MAG: adenylyltransferase/cytidyltransferase family protein [Bdellovibrionales bacterium]|nr:adenylyltransferase/cytidyltransferase family protein [Bdellovibrionales bacterium]
MNDATSSNQPYVVFGGTFDPIHSGHVSAIRLLLEKFCRVVIAPTAQNPWKNAPHATLKQRIEMLDLVLKAEKIDCSHNPAESSVWLCTEPYVYAKDFVRFCQQHLTGELHWAVGEDSKDSVSSWKGWEALNIPIVVVPIRIEVHSNDIRQGDKAVHPALSSYIGAAGLYPRKNGS